MFMLFPLEILGYENGRLYPLSLAPPLFHILIPFCNSFIHSLIYAFIQKIFPEYLLSARYHAKY